MRARISLPHAFPPQLSNLQFHHKRSLPRTNSPPPLPTLTFLNRNSLLRLPQNPTSKLQGLRFDGPVIRIDELTEIEDEDLVVETCITRTLPPALTLQQGLQRIKEAVEKLKMDPPSSASGIFRFQVVVPPSPKALNWFCSQPESSVYPLFFLSKNTDNSTYKSLYLNASRGVFGLGAAIYFTHSSSSSSTSEEPSLSKRYLSIDSTFLMTYGFMDINFNIESSSMRHEAGSSYFFIPQIELDEYEGVSVLAATLAWCDSSFCSFEEAVRSYELSLYQASSHLWSTSEKCQSKCIRSTLRGLNVVEDKTVPMVYMNLLSPGGRETVSDIMELVSSFS